MIQKCLHIILVITVLLSSAGILVNKHFCEKELKSISFFTKAKNCHESNKTCPRHKTTAPEEEEKNCCENEVEYYKIDQDQDIQTLSFELLNPNFLQAFIAVFIQPFTAFAENESHQFLTYRPPIVSKDIVVAFQRFLC